MCSAGCRNKPGAEVIQNQIELLFERGDLNSAASAADRALAQYGADPVWLWRFRVLKARILVSQSAYRDALAILQDPPPAALTAADIAVRRTMVQGMAYRVGRDFAAAGRKLDEAQDLSSREQPQLLCEVLNAKASLEGSRGDYDQAAVDYREALGLARQHDKTYQEAAAQVGLAWVATHQRHFAEAVDRDESALQLVHSLGMEGLAATALGNLAWSYFELGDFEASLDFYKQGAAASAKNGMAGYSAYWFSGVATAYMSLREYADAERFARATLLDAERLKNVETRIACLQALAQVMLHTNRLSEAQQNIEEAETLETHGGDQHDPFSDTLTLAGEIAVAQARYPEAEALFQRVLANENAGPKSRWEAEAGLAAVRNGRGRPAEAERFFRSAIATIEQARQSINHDGLRLSFLSSGIAVYGQYIDFLVQQGRSTDALAQAELSRARSLQEGLDSQSAKPSSRNFKAEEVARRVKATLLFYWLGEKQSHLWIVTQAKTAHLALPPADQIDPVVKSYREALLRSRDPLEAANPDGQKLYEQLVAPALPFIPKNSRVIVLPDGSLYGLNFETLIVPGTTPHYWIEDVTLSTASSLALLADAETHRAPKNRTLFIVGATIPPNAEFPALPQAAAEMQGVENYFPAPQRAVLSGDQATPAAYLTSHPETFAYLHFVTHGTASRTRPLESAVVLSREKNGEAYKLYARDIVNQRLSAYLVTISACNGAGTRAYSGEGLVGLSWAFLRAGAHHVIGALWEVSDSSTPQLMDRLYGALSRGEDPATALRAAKLSLLHSDTVYRKPFYWAPFQLYVGS